MAGDFTLTQMTLSTQIFASELEQAITLLESAKKSPTNTLASQRVDGVQAISQAQEHLLNAQYILDSFRLVINLVIIPTANITHFTSLRQLVAWWTFTNEAVLTGQELLNAAWFGAVTLKNNQLPGLLTETARLQSYLQAAEGHFQQAQAARLQIDVNEPPFFLSTDSLLPALSRWDTMTPSLEQTLPQFRQLLGTLPTALGNERPMTYLVIIQSTDNLRATGGFLAGAGTIRFENGQVTDVTIRDVVEREFATKWSPKEGYLSTRIMPPEPLGRYMGLGHWVLRDGNWWADFPTTARQIDQFWQLSEGQTSIDGVIGLTDQGIATILESIGSISIAGQMLDAKNLKSVASQRIYASTDSTINQESAFFQQVAQTLVSYTERQSTAQWLSLAQYLQIAMQHHDILVSSFDPTLNGVFHDLNLDGAVRGQQDDYFYLVEDNLCDSKLSSFVKQNLRYEVELGENGQPTLATLTIDKINSYKPGVKLLYFPFGYNMGGRWDAQTQRWDTWEGYYGGYLRLFPPPQSHLVMVTGFDDKVDVAMENDRSYFGGYVGLWSAAERQLQFRWIPTGQPRVSGKYHLLVQRQPGALAHPLTVLVHLPPNSRATNIIPAPTAVTEQTVTWRAVLNQDLTFELSLSK